MDDWISKIRSESRLNEDEEALLALSKKQEKQDPAALNRQRAYDTTDHSDFEIQERASSPEFGRMLKPLQRPQRLASPQDYSANEVTSYSEWSDGPGSNTEMPNSQPTGNELSSSAPTVAQSALSREAGKTNEAGNMRDPERVVCSGYLQCLKIRGKVRHWKRLWVVLRAKSLAFYKDEQVW